MNFREHLRPRLFLNLIKQSYQQFSEHDAARLGAALAFYTVFSLAPLLVILIAVAGFFWGDEAVSRELFGQIDGLLGPEGAALLEQMVADAHDSERGLVASILGFAVLIFGASRVFIQLQQSLNSVWKCENSAERGIISGIVRLRLLSFALVLSMGFLLLVSLVAQALLAGFINNLEAVIEFPVIIVQIAHSLSTLLMLTLMFGLLFKVLPDRQLKWRHVSVGAFFTAVLFFLGQTLIGLYLGNSAAASSYGAAGSFVLVLLWVYYSAQILLFGAEFTEVYSRLQESETRAFVGSPRVAQSKVCANNSLTDAEYLEKIGLIQRNRLQSSFKDVEAKLGSVFNPKAWMQFHPWLVISGTLGLGALAGGKIYETATSSKTDTSSVAMENCNCNKGVQIDRSAKFDNGKKGPVKNECSSVPSQILSALTALAFRFTINKSISLFKESYRRDGRGPSTPTE